MIKISFDLLFINQIIKDKGKKVFFLADFNVVYFIGKGYYKSFIIRLVKDFLLLN